MNWVTSAPFVYPALEAAHIVGIGLLIGSLVRVRAARLGLRPCHRRSARSPGWPCRSPLAGFALAATSGLVMFISQFERDDRQQGLRR